MHDLDAPLPPVLDKEGVWRDPLPLEEMTPKQRAGYVRFLREQAAGQSARLEGRPHPSDETAAKVIMEELRKP